MAACMTSTTQQCGSGRLWPMIRVAGRADVTFSDAEEAFRVVDHVGIITQGVQDLFQRDLQASCEGLMVAFDRCST